MDGSNGHYDHVGSAALPVNLTTKCVFCSVQLSYPSGSVYIQCPSCRKTMNPATPNVNYDHCQSCGSLLSHPPSSLTIQCPQCEEVMDLAPGPPPGGYGAVHSQGYRDVPTGGKRPMGHPAYSGGAATMRALGGSFGVPQGAGSGAGVVGAGSAPAGAMSAPAPRGGGKGTVSAGAVGGGAGGAGGGAGGVAAGAPGGAAAGDKDNQPKKKKDPNAPKRASNAYMIFCKEQRSELKKKNPDMAFGKIGAQLGEIWRNYPAELKKPYEDRALVDRERYKRDMERYQLLVPAAKKMKLEELDQDDGGDSDEESD